MPPSIELLSELLARVEAELPRAVELRRRLHRAPELAHQEHATARAIAEALDLEVQTAAGTGLVARTPGRAPAVAVRAELDGLPVRECTGSDVAATNGAMHACGHDVHAAALVALLRAAHALGDRLPAPLVAVFQPSEEAYPSGAEMLVDGGALAAGIAAVVGVHLQPELPWQALAISGGPVNASCDNVRITVSGRQAHGAYPHLGRDPVLAISSIVVALHTLISRRLDPLHPAVITVGELHAGTAENVIPGEATAGLTLRTHVDADRHRLRELVAEVATGTAQAHGCTAVVTTTAGEPVLHNDPGISARAQELAPAAGLQVAEAWGSCGSDDFAFFGAVAPIAMAFAGLRGAPGFVERPLHHPEFLPPDDAVGAVARAQAVLYAAAAAVPA
jgi:amidohydrolase